MRVAILFLWTLVMGCSLWFNMQAVKTAAKANIYSSSLLQARAIFDRDVLYRRWNSSMVGVYAQGASSNPYLHHEIREIVSANGQPLVLINPAYMSRLIGEMDTDVITKITSNYPINPGNRPDDWEYTALQEIESGRVEEVSEIRPMEHNGKTQDYLRFIRQLVTEPSCIRCHPDYAVGQVRGGISISVPVASAISVEGEYLTLKVSHIAIWLMGMFMVVVVSAGRRRKEV